MFFLNTRFSFFKKTIVNEVSKLMHEIILICHEIEYLNDQTKMFNYLFLSKSEKDFFRNGSVPNNLDKSVCSCLSLTSRITYISAQFKSFFY